LAREGGGMSADRLFAEHKDHLDVGILFIGDPAELLHGSLLFDLVSSLRSYRASSARCPYIAFICGAALGRE